MDAVMRKRQTYHYETA